MLYTLTALPSVPGSRESVTNIPLDTLVALHMYYYTYGYMDCMTHTCTTL